MSTGSRLLAIFDLDGTLIDSRSLMLDAFTAAHLESVGEGEPPIAQFLALLGAPFPEILRQLGLPPAMADSFKRSSMEGLARIVLHHDAVGAVEQARGLGIATAICTGKDRARTEAILRHFGLTDHFDAIVSGDDPPCGKPAPDGVLALIEELGSCPDRSLMVGDSPLDIAAGRSAGASTIGCLWGLSTSEAIEQAAPDHILEQPTQLGSLLADWSTQLVG